MNANSKPSSVIREIGDALKDPAGQIKTRSDELLDLFPPKQLDENLQHFLGKLPSRLEHYGYKPFEASGSAAGMARHLADTWKRGGEINRRKTLMRLMRSYIIARPTIALEDREKGYLRSMAALCGDGSITQREFNAFLAEFCWCEGQCVLNPSLAATRDKLEPQARALLGRILQLHLRLYKQFLAATAALIAGSRGNGQASGQTITAFLNQGSAWADPELGTSNTYRLEQTNPSLIIGFTGQDRRSVYYDADESLITIAGPGTGKSQVQVIPNLVCYPGSAFVLDVKGELWAATAGHRARHYGPVYRFAPTDPGGHTHRYNPFDFVSGDPQQAAVDCELISTQIIPPNSEAKDPFWDNRARDFLWTFALATALSEPPERRNLATVMEMLAIPVNFVEGVRDTAYQQSPTPALLARLKHLAAEFHIPALAQTAVAIESGLK
jgi:type IV secretion system protein VirD4